MDYENQNILPEEEQYTPQPETQAEQYAYRGQGRGQKESPFADSPYEMNHEPRYSGQYEKPRKPKKQKTGGFWKKALAVVAVLALVAGIDLTDKNFWRSALQIVAHDIDRFCALVQDNPQ